VATQRQGEPRETRETPYSPQARLGARVGPSIVVTVGPEVLLSRECGHAQADAAGSIRGSASMRPKVSRLRSEKTRISPGPGPRTARWFGDRRSCCTEIPAPQDGPLSDACRLFHRPAGGQTAIRLSRSLSCVAGHELRAGEFRFGPTSSPSSSQAITARWATKRQRSKWGGGLLRFVLSGDATSREVGFRLPRESGHRSALISARGLCVEACRGRSVSRSERA